MLYIIHTALCSNFKNRFNPVHHAERVRVAIESVGAKVKFLPPYSPDLSPIELCWSKLKQFLRSCEARTTQSRWPCNGSGCQLHYRR